MTRTKSYTSKQVCELTGATYRQVDYWCRKGHVPGQDHVVGSGNRRLFTPTQVARVGILVRASMLVNATLDEAADLLQSETA